MRLVDEVLPIDGNEALEMSKQLARQEGIFVGTSGGATFAGAMKVARQAPPNSTILCMLPDTAERYLSTPLFEGIPEEMTEEELEISRSTPGYRFDVSSPPPPAAKPAAPEQPTARATAFVDEVLADQARRDRLDSERALSPLTQSGDMVRVDTTALNAEEVVNLLLERIRRVKREAR